MANKHKCYRCKARTPEGLYIKVTRRGSVIGSETHPLCPGCAVEFWKWIDEMGTRIAYHSIRSMKEALRKKENRLRKRLAYVRKREKRLIERAENKEVQVILRAH